MVDADGDERVVQPSSGRLNQAVAQGQWCVRGNNEEGRTGAHAAGDGQVQRSVK